MEKLQKDLLKFQTKLGELEAEHNPPGMPATRVGDTPQLRNVDMRVRFIEEEVGEMIAAMKRGDLVETIDGAVDAIYVILGTLVEAGVDMDPHWDEVQRTNMAKLGPDVVWAGDGKLIKPPGWKRPDLAGILRKQMAEQGLFVDS